MQNDLVRHEFDVGKEFTENAETLTLRQCKFPSDVRFCEFNIGRVAVLKLIDCEAARITVESAYLHTIYISGEHAVEVLMQNCAELESLSLKRCKNLAVLEISSSDQLQELVLDKTSIADLSSAQLPNLEVLQIESSPLAQLKDFPSLRSCTLYKTHLQEFAIAAPELRSLKIENVDTLHKIDTSLCLSLEVAFFSQLKGVSELNLAQCSRLSSLTATYCDSLATVTLASNCLKSLFLIKNPEFRSIECAFEWTRSLTELTITQCPKFEASDYLEPSNLAHLNAYEYERSGIDTFEYLEKVVETGNLNLLIGGISFLSRNYEAVVNTEMFNKTLSFLRQVSRYFEKEGIDRDLLRLGIQIARVFESTNEMSLKVNIVSTFAKIGHEKLRSLEDTNSQTRANVAKFDKFVTTVANGAPIIEEIERSYPSAQILTCPVILKPSVLKLIQENSDTHCAICFDDFSESLAKCFFIECGHCICYSCFMAIGNMCYMCRKVESRIIKEEDFKLMRQLSELPDYAHLYSLLQSSVI